MIQREILGPQERFERSGTQGLRDVRPFTARFVEGLKSSASALVLAGLAGATFFYPASLDLTLPASMLYATWVLSQRAILPIRLPRSAGVRDYNYPDPGTRRARMAAGSIFLGWEQGTGQELWITNEDGRQHGTIPGTTGAGKTTAILSLLSNSLTHGSGFVLVDGKADNQLYGQVYALARSFGREDDVLALNFLTASGIKESNTFNPFAAGNADAIRELLASQLGEQQANDSNGVFRARAIALIGTMAPVLVWMRDHKGVPINIETIRFALELRGIWMLATQRIFCSRNAETGDVIEIPVPEMPEDIIYPASAYLGELPGYDTSVPYNEQKGDEPSKQHGFALFYFTATFTQLAVSLGHIFKVLSGDVDMRDVVLNRRILVVNLPALENSDDTLAALGKIVVASLRGMLAQLLGSRLSGESSEIFSLKPGMGEGPFHVAFDELAYYATNGMDRMLAMGRGLNIMFWLGFQELSGIWARLGEKTASLLGNANLTIAMRQQDAQRTREWIEKTAGQTYVTQATSFQGGSDGVYREAQHAEMRQVGRVEWNDLQRLLEGEAIVLFGGRRVYAKLFQAKVDSNGPIRLNMPLMLAAPSVQEERSRREGIGALTALIEAGELLRGTPVEVSPVLRAAIDGFKASKAPDVSGRVAAAIAAVGTVPPDPRPDGTHAEPPVSTLSSMLDAAAEGAADGNAEQGHPGASVDPEALPLLTEIERHGGATSAAARRNSLAAIGASQEAGSATSLRSPPPMTAAELRGRIDGIVERLAA
ncbi:type IV secretory system conjugative DNA transfer family protein [Roseomonas gilardii]|uniref:type IV secretory system conjugative DNA transfer family protein n=1 Tax=Roseomonas gilardii TaxID=257708 RepID=UPI0011A76716|nr:TraM recognition domain-containing protein [Roseomonas gilardii]